eukprot:TRINITY_DN4230_c0_g1_i4.p1 TRINITY_DN4230_c0_g1~~TRINITY_DN4230_c0_g1_i4.p1  ORF type:complete len:356 (-),score=51.95 TRINITY_DN4230_c0_g1_i4:339-1406(-)
MQTGSTLRALLLPALLMMWLPLASALPATSQASEVSAPIPTMLRPSDLESLPPAKIWERGIPKILHFMWKDRDISPVHRPYAESWARCLDGQDWRMVLWTDEDLDNLVRTRGPKWFVPTWDAYSNVIQRVDTSRYVLLLVWGGLFADLDNECLAYPTLPTGTGNCHLYFADQPPHQVAQFQRYLAWIELVKDANEDLRARPIPAPVQNSLMISAADHPFWLNLLAMAVERGPVSNPWQGWFGVGTIGCGWNQVVPWTVGVDLCSSANFLYGAANDTTVCTVPNREWGHSSVDDKADPKIYVRHHGTHTWVSPLETHEKVLQYLLPVSFVVGLVAFIGYRLHSRKFKPKPARRIHR